MTESMATGSAVATVAGGSGREIEPATANDDEDDENDDDDDDGGRNGRYDPRGDRQGCVDRNRDGICDYRQIPMTAARVLFP
jgi:hypothetical protein